MTFRRLMGVAKRRCLVVLVILICVSLATCLKDHEEEELILSQLADPITGDVNTEMAELLLVKCNLDLFQLEETIDGTDSCSEERPRNTNGINFECRMLAKEKTNRMLSSMHPQMKQALLDCLRKNFHVSGKDYNSEAWYTRYLESLLFMPGSLRRKLSSRWVRSAKEVPAPAPDSSDPVSSPRPKSKKTPFFPPDSANSSPSGDETPSRKASSTGGEKEKKSNNHQTVVIAVVVTATVTFIIVALLFLCYNKSGSRVKQNDENHERPLLSLSLSSSPKYSAFGNSIKEDMLMNQSSSLSHHQRTPSLDGSLHVVSDGARTSMQGPPSFGAAGIANKSSFGATNMAGGTNGLLPPPPGAMPVTVEIIPPLKPPPGRALPLPPEPPSSFKPPSSMATPPPPPPPRPPPRLPPAIPPAVSPAAPSAAPPAPPPRPPGNSGHPSGPPPPPPPVPANKAGPRPPPPPKSGAGPPRPPPLVPKGANPPRPPKSFGHDDEGMDESGVPKAKLKPFFWDKVLANPDNSMVWHQIKAGSFQFNEEMIETLFGYTPVDKNKSEGKKESSSQDPVHQYIQIIDSKKAQNLSILLRALNVTKEEVCDALHEGAELPAELLENLLRMAPTPEEELKLRLFSGELSQLGNAERFLKCLVDIPFAFKRLESLLFMGTLQEDITITKESFVNLEVACKELRSSRLFLKLLEAVLKTGNRMNDGTFRGGAQAFKLDTLLKLSDVKGKDGKTTLLHFVVQEIIRTEGIRAARNATGSQSFSSTSSKELLDGTTNDPEEHYRNLGLEVVSGLSGELQNVKKAATIDADALTGTVSKLGHALLRTRDFVNKDMQSLGEESKFHEILKTFVQKAEVEIMALLEEEKRIMELVKSTGDYFHGHAGKDEGLRLFVIVRDFLIMIDKTCREIKDAQKKQAKGHRKVVSSSDINHPPSTPVAPSTPAAPPTPDAPSTPAAPPTPAAPTPAAPELRHPPSPDLNQLIFPAIIDRRISDSSSDDESP